MAELKGEYCSCGSPFDGDDSKNVVVSGVKFHPSCIASIQYNAQMRNEELFIDTRLNHPKVTYVPRREVALS